MKNFKASDIVKLIYLSAPETKHRLYVYIFYVTGKSNDTKNYNIGLFPDIENLLNQKNKLVGLLFCPLSLTFSWYNIPLVNKKGSLKSM